MHCDGWIDKNNYPNCDRKLPTSAGHSKHKITLSYIYGEIPCKQGLFDEAPGSISERVLNVFVNVIMWIVISLVIKHKKSI